MTLIELVIAVAIGAIVLAALNSVVSLGLRAQAEGGQSNELLYQGQFALERMVTTARGVPPKLLATPTAGTTGDWFSPVMYGRNGCNQLIETSSIPKVTSTVATVNSTSGVATGVAGGTSVITATYLGIPGSTTLTVTPATSVSIAVTPATASVPISGTQQFMACATYSDGSTRDVTASSSWTSGTVSVATVNGTSGVAIGVASATSVITANFGGKAGSATLTVTSATLSSIAVTPATLSIPINGTQPFMATATYSDGSTRDVTASSSWTSDTTGVATVLLTTGVATGVAGGTSVITANFGGKADSATLTVTGTGTTAPLVSIAVTPVTASVPISGTQQFVATAKYSDGSTRDVTALSNWTSGDPSIGPKVIAANVTAFSAQPILGTGPVDDGHKPAGTLGLTLTHSAAAQAVPLATSVRLGGGTQ